MRRVRVRIRAAWRALWQSQQLDAAMHEEMRSHIEMEAERLVCDHGLDRQEAYRRAHVAFGGIEKYKEAGRDIRGLQWLDALSLDARLGVRMLVKHRWLTFVGGFAMAVAIAIGATAFEIASEALDTTLPIAGGERLVAVQYATGNPESPERRVLRDFAEWRDAIVSLEHLAAFRTVRHNLVVGDAPPETIKVAEMTPSGFVLAGTAPLLGRHLLAADEREGAPLVLVIGYDVWRARFGAGPQVVGRRVNLGDRAYTIVGVMPDRFEFPTSHQYWIALGANALAYERLQGPELFVFGRLAPDASMEEAQAELALVGQRTAAAYPKLYERLRLVLLPYTREYLELIDPVLLWLFRGAQILIGALAVVVSVNLAILLYARTVTRLGEIAVRTALGATRRRILAQLFMEAFALTMVGAAVGLAFASVALRVAQSLAEANGNVPFWLQFELSAATVFYAFVLATVAAIIMGVLPGVKATGRRVNTNLHELSGRSGTRLGPVWTTLVVAQVSAAVAILPAAVYLSWHVIRLELVGAGFAAEKFVVGTAAFSRDRASADANRLRSRHVDLLSRLKAEPGVAAVTFSSAVPGFAGDRLIEFAADETLQTAERLEVSGIDVDVDLFEAYDVELLAGRRFTSGDIGPANAVVVNRALVNELRDGRSPLGRPFRYAEREEWYHIVGVVNDFPRFSPSPGSEGVPTIYHPAGAGDLDPVVVSVRFNSSVPPGFVDRFRAIGAEVDPGLQLRRVVPLTTIYDEVRSFWRYLGAALAGMTATVLLLSAAGIYALMSFTVTQRKREIGIRAALGAAPHRLLFSIFARAVRQLALGLLLGSLLTGLAIAATGLALAEVAMLSFAVASMMLLVGLLAALGPARRGLRIQASEALRET